MKKIIITNESTMTAEGKRSNGNCKPVLCIDTGVVYASVMDAAEKNGVHFITISMACLGKTKTCKGKRYCFVADMSEHYEEIAQYIREMYEDHLIVEKQRAEERRIVEEQKRIDKAKADYAKACEQYNKSRITVEKAREELYMLGVTEI